VEIDSICSRQMTRKIHGSNIALQAGKIVTLGLVKCAECVFHVIVGTDSTGSWARIPREGGHGFHAIVGTSF